MSRDRAEPPAPPEGEPGPEAEPGPEGEPRTELGWIAGEVRDEFPELRLVVANVCAVPARRSPQPVKERLRDLSNRFHGAKAINMRREPIPAAYRIFYRHIGLDPDATRTPVEAAVLERMLRGAFESRSLLDDALLIALVETGVAIWALDGDAVDGPLGIRLADEGEALGRSSGAFVLPAGRLVVADASAALAVLFGALAPGHGVTPRTRRMTLFSVQVAGVPSIHVEEAMWECVSVLRDG
jgi:DNA/RNA-binding domain of Phe-tRNA-synthetase-like protein